MDVVITYNQRELKNLIIEDIKRKLGDIPIDTTLLSIETKSQQNYKSEWEQASFRATYRAVTL